MNQNIFYIVSLTILALCLHFISGEKLSKTECLELGFESEQLWCDKCDELKKFQLSELKKSCLKCCKNDENATKKVRIHFSL